MTEAELREIEDWMLDNGYSMSDYVMAAICRLIARIRELEQERDKDYTDMRSFQEKFILADSRVRELEQQLTELGKDREYCLRADITNEWEERFEIQRRRIVELEQQINDLWRERMYHAGRPSFEDE